MGGPGGKPFSREPTFLKRYAITHTKTASSVKEVSDIVRVMQVLGDGANYKVGGHSELLDLYLYLH